ncbi:hypothetical protein PBY51_002377 [Eleginops maclovinus]|uniref:Uncharacterized protein n=1 Tax=Eleginops maclovinus TaxID=56733 RepID=A0AAN7XCT5_ELEMC|nr:hypothetical protein PBY51_002377 [Eleginops maclovinus]
MWDHPICLPLSDCLSIFKQLSPRPPSLAPQFNSVLADIHRRIDSITSRHASHEPFGDPLRRDIQPDVQR